MILIWFYWLLIVTGLVLPESGINNGANDIESTDPYSVLLDVFTDDQFDILEELEETLEINLYSEKSKRDLEDTIESVLNMVNNSGLIFDALDYGSEHPNIISYIANATANLINSQLDADRNISAIVSFLRGTVSGVNGTALGNAIVDSGLVQSVLDGVLLDEETRGHVADIIYNLIENNINLIAIIGRRFLQPANQNSKRDDHEGSLIELVGNIAGGFLGSGMFLDGFEGIVNALNDSGIVVYTVQRILATPEYINMTGDLLSQVIDQANVTLPSINITAILASALSDTSRLTRIVGALLRGDFSAIFSGAGSLGRRYIPGVRAIIRNLEDRGLFDDLNQALFPSSSGSNRQVEPTHILETNVTEVQTESLGSKAYLFNSLMAIQAGFIVLFFS